MSKDIYLKKNILDKDVELISTREGFGQGLVEAGEKNPNVVALCADLTGSTKVSAFKEKFPERYIQTGIAEQNMANIAVGLALQGKVPFLATYAVFSPGRNWDQIRISGCYNKANVKYAGAHSGISVGADGATHQALEDIALTRCLPRLTVLVPCDVEETRKVTIAAAEIDGPVYFRYSREATPAITTAKTPFQIGKAQIFRAGTDVAIINAGPLMQRALVAADRLVEKGISCRVINSPSVKPLDEDTIAQAARDCRAVVTVEEHQVMGGFGSAVAEFLSQTCPVPIEFIGAKDTFGESGQPEELLKKYKMNAEAIEEAVQKVHQRKRT